MENNEEIKEELKNDNRQAEQTQNSIYTDSELEIIKSAQDIRTKIATSMVKDGVPTKSGDIRVLNEVLTANEKSAHDSATNRLKHQDNSNTEAQLNMVAAILKKTAINPEDTTPTDLTIKDDLKNIDTVEGELEIRPDKLELEDFIQSKGE